MTEIEQFELLMHGVQALRRHVECLSCPISGASGVRAQFYPHQVQNVQRILSSTRVHHLIADEVGMGKTIQALMIANALRLQYESLRVRIVVPRAELKNQWIEEIAWRAQCIAELGDETIGDDWFDVVDDTTINKPSEALASDNFDLLILDEPQSLRQDTLRFVASNSDDFTHLLLLTASPNLRDIRRFLELLQMLEPDRLERARREADSGSEHKDLDWSRSRIGDLRDTELRLVYEQFTKQTAEVTNGQLDTSIQPPGVSAAYQSFAEFRRIRVLAETRWRYRRILRSYRTDFPVHLPRRIPKRLIVEGTFQERERMRTSLCYVGDKDRHFASAFLGRTALGGHSLQARITQLRRGEAEHEPLLMEMSEYSRREYADSRLDCLVDWLIRFWLDDPKRKAVIAAEDNVTVEELGEELGWRIPEVGSRGRRVELKLVLAKDERFAEQSEDETLDSQTLRTFANSTLRAFGESNDQLLIAHNVFRQSYNLQAADALIFYMLPWKPEDVDQWIGRVDRLGREFVDPERPSSKPKPIHIVTLHRRGDPTIAVQEVLDEYRIFETAIDPERRLLEQISEDIEARALPTSAPATGKCGQLEFDLDSDQEEVIAAIRPRGENETAVPTGSAWTVPRAIELHQQVSRRHDLGPVLRQNKYLGYVTSPSEKALAHWINLLRNHKWVNVVTKRGEKQPTGRRSRTYYTFGQDQSVVIKLDCLQDRKHPFPPFFIARGNIQRPPRTTVETGKDNDGNPRYEVLEFLSFGSRVHRDIVNTFRHAGKTTHPFGIKVYSLGERHYPKGTELTRGIYLCGVGFIDPVFCYQYFEAHKVLLSDLPSAGGVLQESTRSRAVANFWAGILSDIRFLRIHRPPSLSCLAWRLGQGNRMEPCSEQLAADILGADWRKAERPNTERKHLSEDYKNKLPAFCAEQIAASTKARWRSGIADFQDSVAERQEILRIELSDRLWVLGAAVDEVEREVSRRERQRTDANSQAIVNNYRPRLKRIGEEIELTKRSYKVRIDLLSKSLRHIQEPALSTVHLQCSAVVELENDPVPLPAVNKSDESTGKVDTGFTDVPLRSEEVQTVYAPRKPR